MRDRLSVSYIVLYLYPFNVYRPLLTVPPFHLVLFPLPLTTPDRYTTNIILRVPPTWRTTPTTWPRGGDREGPGKRTLLPDMADVVLGRTRPGDRRVSQLGYLLWPSWDSSCDSSLIIKIVFSRRREFEERRIRCPIVTNIRSDFQCRERPNVIDKGGGPKFNYEGW